MILFAEWHLFLWRVLPPAVSVMSAAGIGELWWVSIPGILAFTIVPSLLWKPGRAIGAYLILVGLLAAQVLSALVFLLACDEVLGAIAKL